MDIPKSLESTWRNVSQDKKITKADYDLLVKAAAPTGKDEELDNNEIEFLGKLKSELEKTAGAKGSIPVEGLSFVQNTPPSVIKESDIGEVPSSLLEAWNTAMEDGNINEDEYKFLLDVAAPNWSDEELDPKEKAFLGNLQALLKNSGSVNIAKKEEAPAKTATAETNPNTATEENEEVSADTQTSPSKINAVNTETDESLQALNDVNNILDALGNDPDFAPLKSIVNQRLTNSTSAKKFSDDVNKIISAVEPGKASSVAEAKTKLQALYDGLPAGVKANPEIGNMLTYAMGSLDSKLNPSKPKTNPASTTQPQNKPAENSNVPQSLKATWSKVAADGKIDKNEYTELLKAASPNGKDEEFDQAEVNFLTDLKQKVDNSSNGIYSFVDDAPEVTTNGATTENTQPSILSEIGNVPESLKGEWDKLVAKGSVNNEDFNNLVKTAAPNGKDEEFTPEEHEFLTKLKAKVEESGQNLSLADSSAQTNNAIAPASNNKPVLLNWPGYTKETKGALKKAFGSSVSNGAMPILKGSEGLKIAKAFGVQNIRQLQQLVKANPDGKFGPETFFKAKVYIANEMNKEGADKARLSAMLNALGNNDEEVKAMKSGVSGASTEGMSTQSKAEPESDGVPETLRATWNQVTADGKLTKADYEKLVQAASPNKKNSEFDDTELEFLAGIKESFDTNKVDELEVNKPKTETPTKESTTAAADDGVPATLKAAWNKVTADGKLTKADYEQLVKAASPNKKNSEFDDSELEFLASVKDMFDQNKVEVLEINKPASTQQPTEKTETKPTGNSVEDSVPSTLKSTWNKVTADGKLTRADYEQLVKAASPNKKNSEFDNSELEFLKAVKDMFDTNKADVLEVVKPQAETTKTPPKTETGKTNKVSASSFAPPQSLKATWSKVVADGKITNADYEQLMKAAAPNKKNNEFENDEIEFLGSLKEKLSAAGGTLNIS